MGDNRFITPLKKRFEEKVIQIPFSDCHYWIAGTNAGGYGRISTGERRPDGSSIVTMAHRASYELYVGKIPRGIMVLHNCDNRLCVNPNHLRLGTNSDNMKDLALRYKRKVSLVDAAIIKSRLKSGDRIVDIAKDFGVKRYYIENIKYGHSRKYA